MLKRKNNLLILFILFILFTLLFIECRSQNHQIRQYFNDLKDQASNDCMSTDFNLYSLEKDSSNLNKLKEGCKVYGIMYDKMNEGVMVLINSPQVKDAKNDFVIINTITSNLTIPAPTISILKIKDKEELFVVRKDEENKMNKEFYKSINSNDDFLLEKKRDIIAIENYLMKDKKNNVTETVEDMIKSSNYHVVARINGKYIIKELYCTQLSQ